MNKYKVLSDCKHKIETGKSPQVYSRRIDNRFLKAGTNLIGSTIFSSLYNNDSPVMLLIRDIFPKLASDRTFSLREITWLALTGFSSLATRTFPKQYYLLSAILNSRNF